MKIKNVVSVIIAGLIIASVYSCSKSNTSTSSQTPPPVVGNGNNLTINISGMAFPASTTVTKGDTISWYNGDGVTHTVTSDNGTSFSSGNIAAGATFSYIAKTAGSFPYHCTIHTSMVGTLVVNP